MTFLMGAVYLPIYKEKYNINIHITAYTLQQLHQAKRHAQKCGDDNNNIIET